MVAETTSSQKHLIKHDGSGASTLPSSLPRTEMNMKKVKEIAKLSDDPSLQTNEQQRASGHQVMDSNAHTDSPSPNPDHEASLFSNRITTARKLAESRVPAPTDNDFFLPLRVHYIRRPRPDPRSLLPPGHPLLLVLKPLNHRAPPCLQCSAKKMPCSFERLKPKDLDDDGGVASCARCLRHGEAFCIKQLPERLEDDGVLTKAGPPPDLPPDVAERARQLAQGKLRDVCGVMLSTESCSGFVLPKWHDNDKPENRQDPDYEPRTWGEQLYQRKVEILVKMRKKINASDGR